MKNTWWKKNCVFPELSIRDAMKIVDATERQIIFIIDRDETLLGTITDGDIRRSILKGAGLSSPLKEVMNLLPITVNPSDTDADAYLLMTRYGINFIPCLDENKKIIKVHSLSDYFAYRKFSNPIVIMAGGEGLRLRPLTANCPKPLLKIKGKPVLEYLIDSFITQGFEKFYISVNYKSEMIQDYFKDGRQKRVNIEYLTETKKLGTAGSLSLLPHNLEEPFFVINADLMVDLDFREVLQFHKNSKCDATMCIREHYFKIPFGVVTLENDHLVKIEEKPNNSFFINAGIYVLNPSVLKHLKKEEHLDMSTYLSNLVNQKYKVNTFNINGEWTDIGELEDYYKLK